MHAIMSIGPVTVGMMTYDSFYAYTGGVYQPSADEAEMGGHAVQVVGWGTSSSGGQQYWIIENSWVCPPELKLKIPA